MSLQVWFPLNGNLNNYGVSNTTLVTNSGATVNSAGKIGNCYSFNGSNNYLTVDVKTSVRMSFCCWVYFTNLSDGAQLIDCRNSSGTGYQPTYINSSTIQIGNSQNGFTNLSYSFSTSKWYHIAVTNDENKARAYVNGDFIGESANGGYDFGTLNITIGARCSRNMYFLNGKLNDIRIYDHCLSAKEVKEISQALVLHYPLRDTGIEPTTNIYPGWSGTCYNGVNGKYGYGSETDIYYTSLPDDVKRVYTGTNFATNWPFVYFGNLTPSVGNYKTISFDYYPSALTGINFYSYNTSGSISWILNGQAGTGGNITGIVLDKWNHIEVTIKNTGSTTDGFGYMRIGTSSHTTNVSNFWMFKNVQIEEKDHATAYTAGTRTVDTIADCSGYNRNGAVTSNTCPIVVNGGGRNSICYQFDGANQAIQIPFNNAIPTGGDGIFTMNVWAYHDSTWSSKTWETIFGGPSGFELEMKNGSTNSPVLYAYSWNKGSAAYDLNKWNMITMVRTTSDTKFYINGVLKFTGTTGSLPAGDYYIGSWKDYASQNYKGKISDFRIYATALSADDVARLYKTSASVDKSKKLHCYELVEE